ncbi:O-antigen ligase family protein [Dyella sp. C9]|uniref:O-antigen ligase family protein n=1 Tax=Dyella sp. C9 TaxID=2202154 RepID=UPI000DEEE03F|nr:O-antigen ligase family protein [Dyella sp. C9]
MINTSTLSAGSRGSRGLILLIQFAVVLYFITEVMSGPLKVLFYAINLAPLFYLPKVLLLCMPFAHMIVNGRVRANYMGFLLILIVSVTTDLLIFKNLQQSIFGLYIFAPLIFGCYFGDQLFDKRFEWLIERVWWLAILGVFINCFVDFPWATAELDIDGQKVTAVKEWSTFGFSRISGFSGASYSAATQVMILCIFLITRTEKKYKIFYFLLSLAAVTATTTKGAIITLLLAGLFYLNRKKVLYMSAVGTLCILNIALPLKALHDYNSNVDIGSHFESLSFGFFTVETMFERMQWMWPMSLDFINTHMIPLLGVGVGGIGAPLAKFYDPTIVFSSTDSLFIYIYGCFGLVGALALIYYALKAIRHARTTPNGMYAKLSLLSVFAYGLTGSPVERGLFLLFVGFSMAIPISVRSKQNSSTAQMNICARPANCE